MRATGSVVVFDGFLALYKEGHDDEEEAEDRLLPAMEVGDRLDLGAVTPEQHFTQPPPRYSEASLVRKMEELGIGRPSTYASVLSVLQDREYVRLDQRRFLPEDRGRVVTAFLMNFFSKYVQYTFTADLENQLDDISAGERRWKDVLKDFWADFAKAVEGTAALRVSEVLEALNQDLSAHFFPDPHDGSDPRRCPKCADGRLGLKLGKFGAFIGCSNYPGCSFTKRLTDGGEEGEANGTMEARVLGADPATGKPVTLRKGPYGHYVQLGEAEALPEEPPKTVKAKKAPKKPAKPKMSKPARVSLVKGMDPATITLEIALALLSLPRVVGAHPETGETISAGVGRFGPYLKYQNMFKSLTAGDDVLSIGLNRAVDLLAGARAKTPAIEVGAHPKDGKPITRHAGRFGPYVQHLKVRATLPKSIDPETVTLEQAVQLLAAKAAGGAKTKKKAAK
ncbi:MAG: hypothetical protein A2516_10560 [Alphaproteobacteria bacterium RIFOXYD12_FULL_60_8]|nr:MAG: hypothetical protein A2516_10560 [Alphaproteobacteria bacterium RIFOXYD12_FULL_60_8]